MPPEHPAIIVFDTAAAHCAAAVFRGGKRLAEAVEPMKTGQAERLLPLLEELLAQAGLVWADIGGLGVGIGPGNFTGVRLGVAAARGLSMALNIPAVGISALEMRAASSGSVEVLLPALRGTAYRQRFADGAPLGEIEMVDTATPPETAPLNMARMAALTLARLPDTTTPPAPLYMRPADAAPGADLPPRILDAG